MSLNNPVFVIDSDVKRRAAVSFHLNGHGVRAEPFETIREFVDTLPTQGLILIHDGPDAVAVVQREVVSRQTPLPIVAYGEDPQPMRIVEAVLAGALGYVDWPRAADSLLHTLEQAATRPRSAPVPASREAAARGQIEKLTQREREILGGMSEGLSNREIARVLALSPRTVELHRANMLSKLGVRSSAEAIRMAIETSLAPIGEG